jgi:hypothetical protein
MARNTRFEVIANSASVETAPIARDPSEWHQAVGVARNVCARIFRDGGNPADAVRTFGLEPGTVTDWAAAVERVAQAMCQQQVKRAA